MPENANHASTSELTANASAVRGQRGVQPDCGNVTTSRHGRSSTEHVEFVYWADVAALLDHLGVGRAHMVGQSIGGSIALDLALARPACVATLTSIAGGVSGYRPDLGPDEDGVPWSDMDRLWDEKKWGELAELETQVWVDGWGQPTTRVSRTLRDRVKADVLSTYQAENEEGLPQPLDPRAAGANSARPRRSTIAVLKR